MWGVVVPLAVVMAGVVMGFRYIRTQAPIDSALDAGLLAPIDAGEWLARGGAARVQVPEAGWYRHVEGDDSGRLMLSRPRNDTHVVLLVEKLGRGRTAPPVRELEKRVLAKLEQNFSSHVVLSAEDAPAETGDARRVDVEVSLEKRVVLFRYRLASTSGYVATLACFGPADTGEGCDGVLDSFGWML